MLNPSCALCSSVLLVVSKKSFTTGDTGEHSRTPYSLEWDRFVVCRDSATSPGGASGAIVCEPNFLVASRISGC